MDKLFIAFRKSASFLCLYIGLFGLDLYAAQWARVSSEKAIIFADPAMSSPIGYFKKGQKIRVGEVPRNKGRVLPTVYKTKVVYVRTTDLETSKDLSLVRSATERMKDREVKEAMTSTRLGAGASIYGASSSSFEAVGAKDKENSTLFFGGVSINGAKMKAEKDYHYIVNLDYLSGSKNDAHLSLILVGLGASYELYKSDLFNLGLFGSAEVVPWAQYEVDPLFKVNGHGLGLNTGLEAEVKFSKRWSLTALGGYRYLKLFGFDLPESTPEYQIQDDFSPSLHGLGLSASMSYSW